MNALTEALERLAARRDLTARQAGDAVAEIMDGQASEAAIAAFLAALRVKGETAAELAGAVQAVRDRMTPWPGQFPPLLDTCGTGGDGACTVNISTAAAIVVAACGVPVAKHGNRSASGNSGSAEVLQELGVTYDLEPERASRCLAEVGITFLFAPRYHPALRYAAPVRKALPFRTLFNLIGPLANPARPAYQLVGVGSEAQADLIAHTICELGIERAAVVTGGDGLDEVTLNGATRVCWVERGQTRLEQWTPATFGLPVVRASALRVDGPSQSASLLRRCFERESGPVQYVVLANAAAALHVAGRVESLAAGVARAAEAIDSQAAAQLLDRWAAATLNRSTA